MTRRSNPKARRTRGRPTPKARRPDIESHRKGRMRKSRLVVAGTSVGAFVALTAGVAVANPAPSSSSGSAARSAPTNARNRSLTPTPAPSPAYQDPGSGSQDPGNGADSGWNDPYQGYNDPYQGWSSDPGYSQSQSSFDPGLGGGQTRSGGS
jgi:hypothetical protein